MKNGVINFLKFESQILYDKLLKDKVNGWEQLMRDKCMKNELMDVKTVNIPNLNEHT